MRVAVVGSGAVGGYFGGKLAAVGNDVTFVARGGQYEALRNTGVTLVSDGEAFHLDDVQVVRRVADVAEPDVVLVTVKGWDTDQVAQELARVMPEHCFVLSLQNGVAARSALAAHLPDSSLVGGLCYINAAVTAPGQVTRTGPLQQVTFGEFDGRPSDRTTVLHRALIDAGVDATVSADINRALWEKFVFLVGFSALTSATRSPIGTVRTNPATRALLHQVVTEVVAVAATTGVRLPDDYVRQTVEFCDSLPEEAMASMAHDLLSGRRLELAWLSGHVVALADQAGMAIPVTRVIDALLTPFELGSH